MRSSSAAVEREAACTEYVSGTIKSNFLCNIGFGDPASCDRVRLVLTSKKPVTLFEFNRPAEVMSASTRPRAQRVARIQKMSGIFRQLGYDAPAGNELKNLLVLRQRLD
jgi:hypothetical protein